ncbi:protein adenylyltransferase SelO family protein [Corynebacterium sp. Q4381]|uniref:protein adenylyltransferase SelO family protein n=1 Tax=Corynebacterium sp. Marseille-Q4381 TaxID=3121597 RepID=UPI002FE55055
MQPPQLAHTLADRLPELAHAQPPTRFENPKLVVLNEPLAAELGLDAGWLRTDEGVRWLAGSSGGHAMAYAGHQFGQFVPLLGDGRALLLGSLPHADGTPREIQLKGSGPTTFSRPGSDGVGAIGPMLREYLVSEFMHAVGIPTTRSLAVVDTGEHVVRQQGRVPGGIVVRVAALHLRVGSVQYAATQSAELVDQVVRAAGFDSPAAMLDGVLDAQLSLVASWMRIGFVHGVMNTDNTALSGETIDYGPCAFTETYDPNAVFSSIDAQGRYRFGYQPSIAVWNIARLAEALLPVMDQDAAQAVLADAQERWDRAWNAAVPDPAALAAAGDLFTHAGIVFGPRNGMLERAIVEAEQNGNYAPYFELLSATSDPFNPDAGPEWMKAPEGAFTFQTFCGT